MSNEALQTKKKMKKIAKVCPLMPEKAHDEQEIMETSKVGSDSTSDPQKNTKKDHNQLVCATVEEYMANNPGHNESPEQLYNVIDRLYTFFDVLVAKIGPTKTQTFLAWMLNFPSERLSVVLSKLLQLFEQNNK